MLGAIDYPLGAWSFNSCVSLTPSLSVSLGDIVISWFHHPAQGQLSLCPRGQSDWLWGGEGLHLLLPSTPSGHLAMSTGRSGGKVAAVLPLQAALLMSWGGGWGDMVGASC